MANPNLVDVSTITGEVINGALTTTTTTDLLTAASETLVKVKSGGSVVLFASTIAVPADATLVLVDKNWGLYLEEGDLIEGGASANGDLTYTISYEILNDA